MSFDLRGGKGCKNNSFIFEGSRDRNTTNAYVRSEGVYMNLVPIILWQDMTLKAISVSTDGPETWTAEIHNNQTLIPGATLSVTGADKATVTDLNIKLTEGMELMFYVNGSKINKPRIIIEAA